MIQIENVVFRFGFHGIGQVLEPDGTQGDTFFGFHEFSSPFPTDTLDRVRVIVSGRAGSSWGLVYNATAIEQNQVQGFSFKIRNGSHQASGAVEFQWLAVLENVLVNQPLNLRMGVVQPAFVEAWPHGELVSWPASTPFLRFAYAARPLPAQPSPHNRAAVATGCNLGVHGPTEHVKLAAVAISVDREGDEGIDLQGYNTDSSHGYCASYWLVVQKPPEGAGPPSAGDIQGMWLDSGVVRQKSFAPDGEPGDWQSWDIYFERPFLVPPFVFVTANGTGASAVGLACNVTTHGFTLNARNSGAADVAGFQWVALGCALHCGFG